MKNIKILTTLVCLFCVAQFSFGQNDLNNGRLSSQQPSAVEDDATPASSSHNDVAQEGVYPVDFDYNNPSAQTTEPEQMDNTYPLDIEIIKDEIQASTNPVVIAERVNELNAMIADLRRLTEELRLENQIIRQSLGNCCSDNELGLTAKDAYLLQNAPNPFTGSAQIDYFVPEGLNNVEIQICDFKGVVLKSYPLEDRGYGKLKIEGDGLDQGSFVYMIKVNGEVIDSKVMLITK